MKKIPWILVILRLLAGPLLICLVTWSEPTSWVLLSILLFGILSDIFDGIIARTMGVATPTLRRFDSQTDLVFWLCVIASLVIHRPALAAENQMAFYILVGLEGLCYCVSFVRFKKETCTHAISAKFYGLALFWALSAMLAFGSAGIALKASLTLGIIANIDVILIILLLPTWMSDIPSSYHAWQIRQGRAITRYRIFN